ncbi:hypothetical protein OROMI_004675 [Orobanche minor]
MLFGNRYCCTVGTSGGAELWKLIWAVWFSRSDKVELRRRVFFMVYGHGRDSIDSNDRRRFLNRTTGRSGGTVIFPAKGCRRDGVR